MLCFFITFCVVLRCLLCITSGSFCIALWVWCAGCLWVVAFAGVVLSWGLGCIGFMCFVLCGGGFVVRTDWWFRLVLGFCVV